MEKMIEFYHFYAGAKVIFVKDVKGGRRKPPRTPRILVSKKTAGAKSISAMRINKTTSGEIVPEYKNNIQGEIMYFVSGVEKFINEGKKMDPGTEVHNTLEYPIRS